MESLIRLSEAVARVYCSTVVTVDHVLEAVSLLDKSIVTIDVKDIFLEEEEAN